MVCWGLDVIFKRRQLHLPRSKAAVPKGIRIYAIGDIHGRADLLADKFEAIDADLSGLPATRTLQIFLGDYIDRGPASREVLDLLIDRGRAFPTVCLKGNHESYLIDFLNDPEIFAEWGPFGAIETLLSYGLTPPSVADEYERRQLAADLNLLLPDRQLHFLRGLQLSFSCGDYFFVHAGVRPGVPFAQQREEDMLWIRQDFLLHEESFERIVVHGHTPSIEPDVRFNRINIDTGAYATGRLTCLVLERDQKYFI